MRKILICGYIGFNNFGDEALLHILIRDLINTGFNRNNITVVTNNPADTKSTYSINACNRWNPFEILASIINNEAIIFIGGAFQDKTSFRSFLYYFFILIAAKILGKEIIFYGAGVGPFERRISSSLFSIGVNEVRLATVRDQESQAYFPPQVPVITSCDPVWTIEPDYNIQKDIKDINWQQPIMGISLKLDKYLKPAHIKNIAEKVTKMLIGMKDWQVLLIPLMPNEDLPVLYELQDFISSKIQDIERVKLLEHTENYSIESLTGILGSCDVVVGMRYHSLIVSLSCGKPVFGLIFDHKVKTLIDSTGQVGVIWREDMEQPWNYFWQNIEGSTEKAKLATEKAKKLHQRNIELLNKLLTA
ncbi:MAG: polysaccharide pyruvyl transferase CsaB [Candidatus Melainabacteria bacterium]|nr:polysaccharide pyruvyl transferase CsaB [Candidatus Melainabacteria bacterium]MBI3309007.1 polysaccharide pyruvyl transferase CsaB [Candidatus Melainabacteria bacterium]